MFFTAIKSANLGGHASNLTQILPVDNSLPSTMGSGGKSHRLMAAIDKVTDEHGGWRWNLRLRRGLRKRITSPPLHVLW